MLELSKILFEEEYLLMSETSIEISVVLKQIDSKVLQRYQPYTPEILPEIFSAERASCFTTKPPCCILNFNRGYHKGLRRDNNMVRTHFLKSS